MLLHPRYQHVVNVNLALKNHLCRHTLYLSYYVLIINHGINYANDYRTMECINGFFPHLPQLRVLLNKYQSDIVCLQETNFKLAIRRFKSKIIIHLPLIVTLKSSV